MLRTKSFYINFSCILLLLIPLSLLTGPFLPDFFVVIIDIIFVTFCIKDRNWFFIKNKFFFLFLIFYFYIILTSLFSELILDSLKSSLPYIRFGLFPLAINFLIYKNKKIISYFYLSLIFTFSIIIIDGYYQYFLGQNLFGFSGEGVRMTLLLDDRMELGGYLIRLLPLFLALLFYTNYNLHKVNHIKVLFFAFFIVIALILIFLSGERTSIALTVLSILFIFLLIVMTNKEVRERNIFSTLNGLGITNTEGVEFSQTRSITIFTPIYQSHILGAYKMFVKNPIFGVGPDQFQNLCNRDEYNIDIMTCSRHPHNTYIQLLAETGIIGTIIFLIPLIYVLVISLKQLKSMYSKNKTPILSNYQVCLLLCFLISLWPLAPSHDVFNNWINVIYYLPIGFYLHSINSSKKII